MLRNGNKQETRANEIEENKKNQENGIVLQAVVKIRKLVGVFNYLACETTLLPGSPKVVFGL